VIVAVGDIQVAGCVGGYSAGMIQQRDGGSPAITARGIGSAGGQRNRSGKRNALNDTGGAFRKIQA
jgi:hypothetical protein